LGEIIICGSGLDHQTFANLENVADRIFRCKIKVETDDGFKELNGYWIRTGIMGTVVSNGIICSLGKLENRMTISGRFHDTEGKIKTRS
jgi:hypothetical protein